MFVKAQVMSCKSGPFITSCLPYYSLLPTLHSRHSSPTLVLKYIRPCIHCSFYLEGSFLASSLSICKPYPTVSSVGPSFPDQCIQMYCLSEAVSNSFPCLRCSRAFMTLEYDIYIYLCLYCLSHAIKI